MKDELVIDLRLNGYEMLEQAAGQSSWIPPEYMANDWLSDCAHFLRTGEGIAAIPQAGDAGELVERLEIASGRAFPNEPKTATEELHAAAATTIRTLQARLDAVREEEREAINHARRLAVALREKHFREQSPEWKPLPDLFGLIDQIDNMTTGLTAIRERSGHD